MQRQNGHRIIASATTPLGAPEAESRDNQILRLRNAGKSMRTISYLTETPLSTVGDVCKRWHDSLPEPMPYYRLVDY